MNNIMDLADRATWDHALTLGEETVGAWTRTARLSGIRRIYLVGCGTSCYAGEVGRNILEQIAHLPGQAMHAFNLANYVDSAVLDPDVLLIGISTTGGTQAVVDALNHGRQSGAQTLALTAFAGSPVAQAADGVVLSGGESDLTPVKSKSYVQCLVSLFLIALALADARGKADAARRAYWLGQIDKAAKGARLFLQNRRGDVQALVEAYGEAPMVFMLASGPNLGTVQEGALKVIEMAKMFSEPTELEDFLHGRYREVDQVNPVFFIAPQGRSSAHVLDVLTINSHIKAPSVVFTDVVTEGIRALATHVVQLPVVLDELATPLLYATPLHVFGHQMAIRRGWDPLSRRYDDLYPQRVRYGNLEAGLAP
jgi:glucosamine 6-phosphate synthetase-like amidotransferase/phosphosugar isomerase protein